MLQASRIVSGATHARPTRAGKSGLAHSSLKLQNAAPRTHLRLPRPLVQRREFSNAIKMAKEFGISFYNGSKDLWTNFNESRALKQKKEAGQDLTRSEIRFINRTNDDLWKLGPIFFLNLLPASLIFLSLYIAAVPGALPSTFKIAPWVEKAKKGAAEAKKKGAETFMDHFKTLVNSTPETNDYDHVLTPEVREQVSAIASKVEKQEYVVPSDVTPLSKPFETIMDVVEMEAPLLGSASELVGLANLRIIPMPFRIAKVTKHFAQLASDDKLVMDLPNAELDLNDAELEEFLIERGMTAEGLTREQQLKWASDWLTMAKDPSIVPSVYLLFAAANTHGKIPNHSQLAISDAL